MKLFVAETGSATMASLSEKTEDRLKLISALAFVEVRSAIRRRERSGELLSTHADQALSALADEARRLVEHPLSAKVMVEAAAIVDRRALRSLDALQLATAVVARELESSEQTITFVCSDERLLEAAALEKFATFNPEIG